ncbi:hypothetical protein RB653_001997 [Dictyostelium firmibasis]|uniref:Uncharacterized protein n=1 Tax=Dictyostelium firmibasis TaxID=79012 RepID=A0AAN7TXT2_9MYCE
MIFKKLNYNNNNNKISYIYVCVLSLFLIFSFYSLMNKNKFRFKNDLLNDILNQHDSFDIEVTKSMIIKGRTIVMDSLKESRYCEYIDLVYTWVNGSDPKHIESRIYYHNLEQIQHKEKLKKLKEQKLIKEELLKQEQKKKGYRIVGEKKEKRDDDDDYDDDDDDENFEVKLISYEEEESQRFRDYGSLKYSLRSVRKNVPWIRNIYIVTANQIPSWFNTSNSDNIKFIFHEQLYKNKEDLPTFNSNSIESNFWNLPEEVSNCFLYSNDDLFFREKVEVEDFFDNEYYHNIFETDEIISSWTPNAKKKDLWTRTLINTNKILDKTWHFSEIRKNAQHGVQVFNKEMWSIMSFDLKEQLSITSSNRFRKPNDIQIPYAYNQFVKRYSRKYKKMKQNNQYYALTNDDYKNILSEVSFNQDGYKTICLNDLFQFENITNSQSGLKSDIIVDITNFFESLFPAPSPYENIY